MNLRKLLLVFFLLIFLVLGLLLGVTLDFLALHFFEEEICSSFFSLMGVCTDSCKSRDEMSQARFFGGVSASRS